MIPFSDINIKYIADYNDSYFIFPAKTYAFIRGRRPAAKNDDADAACFYCNILEHAVGACALLDIAECNADSTSIIQQ